jgi:hypothetical protein
MTEKSNSPPAPPSRSTAMADSIKELRERIDALVAKATPGPWWMKPSRVGGDIGIVGAEESHPILAECFAALRRPMEDARAECAINAELITVFFNHWPEISKALSAPTQGADRGGGGESPIQTCGAVTGDDYPSPTQMSESMEPNQDGDAIVGHKTLRGDDGTLRHEPMTRTEADAMLAAADAAQAKRAELWPTSEDAVRGMCEAFHRLKELGWSETVYAPPDGRLKRVIECGSSGIHQGYCERRHDRPNDKWWWLPSPGDLWPSRPVLYLPDDQERAETEARFAAARALIDSERPHG